MKKITLCGSMQFFAEMKSLKNQIEKIGFEVFIPSEEGIAEDYTKLSYQEQIEQKQYYIDTHIEKIKASDAILITNYTKNDIIDYIGANTFLEMAFAYILGKKIFILQGIPAQKNALEIEGMRPIILHANIHLLKNYL